MLCYCRSQADWCLYLWPKLLQRLYFHQTYFKNSLKLNKTHACLQTRSSVRLFQTRKECTAGISAVFFIGHTKVLSYLYHHLEAACKYYFHFFFFFFFFFFAQSLSLYVARGECLCFMNCDQNIITFKIHVPVCILFAILILFAIIILSGLHLSSSYLLVSKWISWKYLRTHSQRGF